MNGSIWSTVRRGNSDQVCEEKHKKTVKSFFENSRNEGLSRSGPKFCFRHFLKPQYIFFQYTVEGGRSYRLSSTSPKNPSFTCQLTPIGVISTTQKVLFKNVFKSPEWRTTLKKTLK